MWGEWEREFGESVEDDLALEPWHAVKVEKNSVGNKLSRWCMTLVQGRVVGAEDRISAVFDRE